MKKTILLVFLMQTLFISTNAWAQSIITKIPKDPTSEDSIKFFGRIQFVKETSYSTMEKFGEVQKGKINYSIEYFCDSKGNLTEFDYSYNTDYANNHPLNQYAANGNGKTIIKYNENGQIYEKRDYIGQQMNTAILWEYDEKGNNIEKSSYGADRVLTGRIVYKYDYNNNRIETNKYDSLGNTVPKEIRNVYREHTIYENRNLIKYTYTYDQYGNWLTRTKYEQGQNTLPSCTEMIEREIEYY